MGIFWKIHFITTSIRLEVMLMDLLSYGSDKNQLKILFSLQTVNRKIA